MKTRFLYLIFLLLPLTAMGQTKAEADSAYMKQDYEKAIEIYEKLLTEGESAVLIYNMGNAYYRMDNMAKAIVNYERALLLQPSFADAKFNLKLAQTKIVDKIHPQSEMFFITWWKAFNRIMSGHAWSIVAICSIVFSCLCCIVLMFMSNRTWRKSLAVVAVLCLLLYILADLFAANLYNAVKYREDAVIQDTSVSVKSTPSDSGTDLFVIHAGLKVHIVDNTMMSWREIQLPDGKRGWIPTQSLEII